MELNEINLNLSLSLNLCLNLNLDLNKILYPHFVRGEDKMLWLKLKAKLKLKLKIKSKVYYFAPNATFTIFSLGPERRRLPVSAGFSFALR